VSLVAPLAPGLWSLVLDVTDDRAGSFAAAGSEVALVEVLVRSATQGVSTAEYRATARAEAATGDHSRQGQR
ncbi:MAG: hypothetical protein ACXWMU_06500, partial [Candidatus Limnocylindrales bacterium]